MAGVADVLKGGGRSRQGWGWRRPRVLLALRTAALASLMVVTAIRVALTWSVYAATGDEPQHIAAGVEWLAGVDHAKHEPWRTVNPPLARVAVGLGPYLAGLRPTLALRQLLYQSPGYARNLALARAGVLPFAALAILLTWVLARRAYGESAAWIAALGISCAPPLLGHAGLATTDVPFTAMFLLALLALMRWLEQPRRLRALAAGLALGLAGATKLSAIWLPGVLVLALLVRKTLGPRATGDGRRTLQQAPVVLVTAALVMWGVYRFSFAAPASLWEPAWMDDALNACFPSTTGRRLAAWLMSHRLPAPRLFLAGLGLCAQEARGRSTAYLLGRITQDGFPAFFPIALAVKTPLPLAALAVLGLVVVARGPGAAGAAGAADIAHAPEQRLRALTPVLAVLVVMAAVIPLRTNIGVRHVLPVYPLLAALAGRGAVALWCAPRIRRAARAGVVALLLWVVALPFRAAPDYLPWFNALAGRRPERVLVDSDLDWGQDLLRLQQEVARRRIDHLSIAYLGASDLCRHGLPPLRWLRPRERARGWIAISEMYRRGVVGFYFRDGDPCDVGQYLLEAPPDPDQYAWLDAYEPAGRVGSSILLYDIP